MGRKKGKAPVKKKIKGWDDDDQDNHDDSDDANACVSNLPVMNTRGDLKAMNAEHDDPISAEKSILMDGFYEKLIKLHGSSSGSGLSFVFSFRETKLDLYLFYREVTERGGFHQVLKDGKWNEVASAFNIKSNLSLTPSQVQKVYETLLYQYEQIYYYRSPTKVSTVPGFECSGAKRKSCDNTSLDDQVVKRNRAADNLRASAVGPGTPEQKLNIQTALDDKEMIMDTCLPRKPRTSYQLFLKMECERLKKIHEERPGTLSFRDMATKAWKHLSQSDRLPYTEASRKDKERFNREMAIYKQHLNTKSAKSQNLFSSSTPSIISFGPSSPIDDDYYVTLEADAGNFFVPDESLVESTIQILKDARSNDPMFRIDWDGCCRSPD